MPSGRPLKNFEDYMDKLRRYAKGCGIKIVYTDCPGDGQYNPQLRQVKLDKDLPESTEVATLLHELGHSLDESLSNKRIIGFYDKAYLAFYSSKGTKKQKLAVLACERRAWVFARAIARNLQIRLGKWFELEQREALRGYKEM